MARTLEDVTCRYCATDAVAMDVKEEPSLYKVGARCVTCDYDYGVIKRVPRADINAVDEVYAIGEESVRALLE